MDHTHWKIVQSDVVIKEEEAISVVTIGLALAKTVFQVHGVDEKGVAVLR